jgi:hypothetical protein
MANRKQTPDVLAEVLGGEPPALYNNGDVTAGRPAAKSSPATKSSKPAQRRPAAPSKTQPEKMQWDYILVSFQDYKGWRPRYINGRELRDWTNGPFIHEYLEAMGEQGWELAAASSGERMYGIGDQHQLYFKKPKSS